MLCVMGPCMGWAGKSLSLITLTLLRIGGWLYSCSKQVRTATVYISLGFVNGESGLGPGMGSAVGAACDAFDDFFCGELELGLVWKA